MLSGPGGVSCTGLSSQLLVGCDQEQNRPGGRIWGGEMVFGWGCGWMMESCDSHKGPLKLAVDHARTCHFQGGQIFSWEWTYNRQAEVTMQAQGGATRFMSREMHGDITAKIFLNDYWRYIKGKHIMISGLKNGITRATNLCPRRFRGRIFQRNVKLLKLYKSTSFKQPGGSTYIILTVP